MNPPPPVQRIRLTYSKNGDARYVGHLDVARFWERVFRRVDLPLAYSHGFNPQPRIQFASALPVGVEGQNELLDVWLTTPIQPSSWLKRIDRNLPLGFHVKNLAEVSLDLPAMQSALRYARYEIRFPAGSVSPEELAARVQALLAEPEIIRPHHKKPGKTYDLRPLIAEMETATVGAEPCLSMTLSAGAKGNARASEVMAALGYSDIRCRVIRHSLILEEPDFATKNDIDNQAAQAVY